MERATIRRLLWLDCSAAAIGGAVMLVVAGLLPSFLGLPRALFVSNGIANLTYGAYSLSLARQASPPRARVWALVAANFVWVGICAVAALYFAASGTALGACYLLSEGVVVGALATAEARALRRPGS